jgi:putative flippase GtrA
MLPERWQRLLREALTFGAVGGVNAAINYAVFNALALTVFTDGQLKANVVATVVATCTSYLMNRHWTYRDRPKSAIHRETSLFFLFNATGLAIELGVLALAKYGLGISGLLALNVAKTIGVGLATIFRFWSYRTFVFRKSPPVDASAAFAAPQASPDGVAAPSGVRRELHRGVDPLTAELAQTLDVDLEAELVTELDAVELKMSPRPPAR